MNAQELRIGNWVSANAPAMKVVLITKTDVDLKIGDSEHIQGLLQHYQYVTPPLYTPSPLPTIKQF